MALLLAPYNEAMRIGMGFNSYTQQLCVNDVVRRPGGVKASERDLTKADLSRDQGVDPSKSTMDLTQASGTGLKKSTDGQNDVSQVVTWSAGFVDNYSSVTESLNISGALKITCAAISGGAGAHASFENSKHFIDSDATYNITVKVTNQRLIADDVTEFTPIPSVPASKFNEVYGDSFISGFIEGGVLSANVFRKILDEEQLNKISGGIEIDLTVGGGALKVEGKAEGAKEDSKKKKATKTTVDITWSGGGDIKPDGITEWDVPTLTKVAMEFADRVALCPQRTFAVITKYTSLRSFHEQTVRGSPLDYEIAGIYTSALLDSYVEYKAMWEDLLQTIKEIDRGTSRVQSRHGSPKLLEYGQLVKEDYDRRIARYNNARQALVKSSSFDSQNMLEEPLPPNEVNPYPADAFGLDRAARECRFEMIKIVREVNEVTYDPKVATDPNRKYRYLSPAIFRLLLPTDKEPLPSPEEIAKMKADLENYIKEAAEHQKQLADAELARKQLKAENGSLQQKVAEQDDQQRKSNEDDQQRSASEKSLQDKVAATEAQLQQAQREIAQKEAKETELLGRVSSAEATVQSKTQEVNSWSQRCLNSENERDQARNQLNSIPEIAIYSVVYGDSQLIDRGDVCDKVRQYAERRWGFNFDNDFFLGDPKPGNRKWGSISYGRRGESPVTICGWEGERSAFR